MASEWYYSRNGKSHGPISSAELRSLAANGGLQRTDHLWKQGMDGWKPADGFPGLFPAETDGVASSDHGTALPVIVVDRRVPAGRRPPTGRPRSKYPARSERLHTPNRSRVVGVQVNTWLAWLPWTALFFGIGSLLQAVAMRLTVIIANTWIRSFPLPSGMGGLGAVEEPLIWTLTFYLCVCQVPVSFVAFPLLRARAFAGWGLAIGSAAAWSLLGLLTVADFKHASVLTAIDIIVGLVFVYALIQLKPYYMPAGQRQTDGVNRRKPAVEAPRPFPVVEAPSVPVVSDTPAATDPLASLKFDVAATSRQMTNKVRSHAKVAGRVATLTAERTRISTVFLPFAYAELGEHCYRTRTHAAAFSDLFAKLDAIHSELAGEDTGMEATGDTIAEQAMAWANHGVRMAKSQAQGVHAKTLLVQLGKACFDQFGPQAGAVELASKVHSLRDRLSTINSEIASSVKNTGGAKTWLVIGGGALLCLAVIGSCVGGRGVAVTSSGGRGSKQKESSVNDLIGREDNLDGCPRGASSSYQEGYARMINMGKVFDRERRQYREVIRRRSEGSSTSNPNDAYAIAQMEKSLDEGTDESRFYLSTELAKFEEMLKTLPKGESGTETVRGMADGCRHALRYILKSKY